MASPQKATSAQEHADPLQSDTKLPINYIITLRQETQIPISAGQISVA